MDIHPKSETLTKAELSEQLYDLIGLNKREAKEVVDLFFDEIRVALVDGEEVKISGFGNFRVREKKARPGRNPKTGEDIPITPRRVVTFRSGQKLRALVSSEESKDEEDTENFNPTSGSDDS